MKRFRSPREKKQLSYERDRRNSYGENPRASVRGIRRRRAWRSRCYRRATRISVDMLARGAEGARFDPRGVRRSTWRKVADMPLGEMLKVKQERLARWEKWRGYLGGGRRD